MYSGAMAFSNRKEEDEFVFCLEGQMYLETDETRAMTGVTERRDNKGSGLFALGSESDSNDDDNNDAEKEAHRILITKKTKRRRRRRRRR